MKRILHCTKTPLALTTLSLFLVLSVLYTTSFLSSAYTGRQLASVISATSEGCYLQSDIDKVKLEGNALLSQISSYDDQLNTLETQIQDTVSQVTENEGKIKELKDSLISEDTIKNQSLIIQDLQNDSSKIQTILDVASSTAFQKNQILEKGKVLTTLNEKIQPFKAIKIGDLKLQLKDRSAVDLKNNSYIDAQKKIVLTQAKYDASLVIDRKNTEVLIAQNVLKLAETRLKVANTRSTRRDAQAAYDAQLLVFNGLNTQLTALNTDFDAKYGRVVINVRNRNLDTRTKVVKKELDDAKLAEANLKKESQASETQYAKQYKNDKRTSVDLSTFITTTESSIASLEAEYKKVKAEQDEIAAKNTQETAVLTRLKNEFAQTRYAILNNIAPAVPVAPVSRRNTGTKNIIENQVDYAAELLLIKKNIEAAKTTYDSYVTARNKTLQEIQVLTDTGANLFETLKSQTTKKAELKSARIGVQNLFDIAIQESLKGPICQAKMVTDETGFINNVLGFLGIDTKTNVSTDTDFIRIESRIPLPFMSDRALSLSNLINNNIKLLSQRNKTTIVPAMKAIDAKVEAGAYDELPDLMEKAQKQINDAEVSLERIITDVSLLKTENNSSTSDFDVKAELDLYVNTANKFINSYNTYFKVLEKFLTDNVPTPELYGSLNQSISTLESSGEEYETQSSNLFSTIEAKNAARQKVVSVKDFTPASQTSIPYTNLIEKVSIEFNKPIEKYLGGTITIKSSDASSFELPILPVNSGEYSISASLPPLRAGETYSVIANIQLQFGAAAYSLEDTNTWTFSIGKDPADMTNNDDKKESEKDSVPDKASEICGDDIDNDENGLTDCQDLECAYTTECTEKNKCGNGIIESIVGEECDDGNLDDGDSCSSTCKVHHVAEDCIDEDENGIHDITGETVECNKERKKGGSCLVCEYEYDTNGPKPTVFRQSCDMASVGMDHTIMTQRGVPFSYTCPEETTNFVIRIFTHSTCDHYGKAGSRVRAILQARGVKYPFLPKEELNFDVVDTGCHSGGGQFTPDGVSISDFKETAKIIANTGVRGMFSQSVNQTYGYYDVSGSNSSDPGTITYFTNIQDKKFSTPVVNAFTCPQTGDACFTPREFSSGTYQEPIVCGPNKEVYYCSPFSPSLKENALYKGAWTKYGSAVRDPNDYIKIR